MSAFDPKRTLTIFFLLRSTVVAHRPSLKVNGRFQSVVENCDCKPRHPRWTARAPAFAFGQRKREELGNDRRQKTLARCNGTIRRCDGDECPSNRATNTETKHPLHHGRRHRLDAAEHLSPWSDGRRDAKH